MKGKTVITFGGGSGCGQAIAKAVAAQGANVVLVGRRKEPLEDTAAAIKNAGGVALALAANICDEAAVEAVVKTTVERFGRVHAIVNSAGLNVPQRTVRTQAIKQFREILDTNLVGTEITMKAILTHMIDNGGGSIVNLGSVAGDEVLLAAGPAYTASKHGLRALTQLVNAQYRHRGVRASHLIFGETETPLRHSSRKPSSVPAPPLLHTDDVANAVLFILNASPRCIVEEVYLNPTVLADHVKFHPPPWGFSDDD